jgi:hypothetical protein
MNPEMKKPLRASLFLVFFHTPAFGKPQQGLFAPAIHRSNLLMRHSTHFVHEMVVTLSGLNGNTKKGYNYRHKSMYISPLYRKVQTLQKGTKTL